jgi:HK97 gp10 family phage protein
MDNLLKNINRAQVAARKAAEREVDRARLAVETTAKKLIQRGPKSGEVYQKYNPKRKHKASAPGQPPATDTGTLVNSIESKRDGLVAVIWTEKAYGKFLEFGTRDIAARPWLTPAVEQNKARFPELLGKSVIESINEAVKK